MTSKAPAALSPADVRFKADLGSMGIKSSRDLSPASAIVGQGHALEALHMGVGMESPGYNIFVAGFKGTGRFAAVKEMISHTQRECPMAMSYSYVHDFQKPDSPALITLPRGMGQKFEKDLETLREDLGEQIPALLGSDVMAKSRQRLSDKYERESKLIFGDFEGRVKEAGFTLAQSRTATGTVTMTDIFPLVEGEPMSMEQLEADPAEAGIDADKLEAMKKSRVGFKSELGELIARHRKLSLRYQGLMKDSEQREVREAIVPLFEQIRSAYTSGDSQVKDWVDGLVAELLDNLSLFRPAPEEGASNGPTMEGFLFLIRSNLIWDPAQGEGLGAQACPVVEEAFPTWRNLFGTVESPSDPPIPSFLDIRAGSLVRANGGFLVLYARDVLSEPRVYDTLKRVLRKGILEIAPPQEGAHQPMPLKPKPIPISVKVVLVGERGTYDTLHARDPDFASMFKIKVEFETTMKVNETTISSYLSVLRRIIDQQKLPHFEADALAVLVEEGVRIGGRRNKITTRFSILADIMREGAHIARDRDSKTVTGKDQREALRSRHRRHNLIERRMMEMIEDGKILIETTGTEVGQVNGLGYYDLDAIQFGLPSRISATCGAGKGGVVNIEREAELSGSIHDKGVLILTGFLTSRFAQDKPLSLQANLAFEQSYAGVDGDSATLAELLALVSALSGLPLRQDIAVTSSLDQRGHVQPVGGVSEKAMGFWHACRIQGLTGTQGVMLPHQNVDDLHLSNEMVEDIEKGQFSIWPATRVEGAIALMFGKSAEEVLELCNEKLASYARTVRDFK